MSVIGPYRFEHKESVTTTLSDRAMWIAGVIYLPFVRVFVQAVSAG